MVYGTTVQYAYRANPTPVPGDFRKPPPKSDAYGYPDDKKKTGACIPYMHTMAHTRAQMITGMKLWPAPVTVTDQVPFPSSDPSEYLTLIYSKRLFFFDENPNYAVKGSERDRNWCTAG